jgi:starch-binding outer membrane protein, SusD/RagB family
VYALWMQNKGGFFRPEVNFSLEILNNGVYDKNPAQLGVRGRVGFGDGDDAIKIGNYIYIHHPFTNQITGWYNYTGNLLAMQIYLLKVIMDERARELAYEGERFYDLMRVAERTNDPAYLADKIAAKFEGADAERIRSLLLDKKNWYVNFFRE